MADDRQAKLRRVEDFRRRVPHVSVSALSAIRQDISKHGLPEFDRREYFREACDT